MDNKKAIQNSPEYKALTSYTATGIAEGFVESESDAQTIAAWQYLHDTNLAYQLQGWFGRTATSMIEQGIIYK